MNAMNYEQLIINTSADQLINGGIAGILVGYFYRRTGNKLSISFNGSKGYLDTIEFQCEGTQRDETNILDIASLRLKSGKYSKKNIYILHSEQNGIRIVIGKLQSGDPKNLKFMPF